MTVDAAALLAWYRRHRRRLPWRDEVSPYRTLVSELMLQQTRVDTVVPYFERFMRDFPTVEALAAAPLEAVLERWAGLGYYSRARNLHLAAQAVVARGGFPATVEGLQALPGIGPYTAGAVGSIALGLDAPVVDGNVERVLCRVNAWAEDPARIKARLWAEAARHLPRGEAGDYNQALMELGATVCAPRAPRCVVCPLAPGCAGRGDPERYPAKAPKSPIPETRWTAVVAWDEGRLLLARRPATGLLGGLWEPPMGEGEDPAAMLRARLGMRVEAVEEVGTVIHVFSHRRQRTRVWRARVSGPPAPVDYADARWVPGAELGGMALSTLAKKVVAKG